MKWDFSVNIDLATRALNTIGQSAREAAVRSLNESAKEVKARATSIISSAYNIKPAAISPKISITEARETNLEARIKASGAKIELIEFASGQSSAGVTVLVKTSHGRKLVEPREAASKGFIVKPKAGKKGIFVRQTEKRFPIRRLFGPSIPQLFGAREIRETLSAFAEERIEEHITEEFK